MSYYSRRLESSVVAIFGSTKEWTRVVEFEVFRVPSHSTTLYTFPAEAFLAEQQNIAQTENKREKERERKQ